jgi:hypothetical protein
MNKYSIEVEHPTNSYNRYSYEVLAMNELDARNIITKMYPFSNIVWSELVDFI